MGRIPISESQTGYWKQHDLPGIKDVASFYPDYGGWSSDFNKKLGLRSSTFAEFKKEFPFEYNGIAMRSKLKINEKNAFISRAIV